MEGNNPIQDSIGFEPHAACSEFQRGCVVLNIGQRRLSFGLQTGVCASTNWERVDANTISLLQMQDAGHSCLAKHNLALGLPDFRLPNLIANDVCPALQHLLVVYVVLLIFFTDRQQLEGSVLLAVLVFSSCIQCQYPFGYRQTVNYSRSTIHPPTQPLGPSTTYLPNHDSAHPWASPSREPFFPAHRRDERRHDVFAVELLFRWWQ